MKTLFMRPDPSSSEFFEGLYSRAEDPWSFETSKYELHRYARIVSILSGKTYVKAFEPGCSIGVLTAKLAPLCEALLATDLSPTAVARAQQRCSELPHVLIRCESLEDTPPSAWDLLVLSEIGYYFTPQCWSVLCEHLIRRLPSGATVLASHWLGHSPDHRMHGDEVHSILRERHGLHLNHSEHNDHFRLDRWCRL